MSALLLALIWCAAPVLSAIHAGAEAHRYCAEHGALEEASEPEPTDVGSDGAVIPLAPERSHEGCVFGRFCRFGQVLGQLVLEPAGDLEATAMGPPVLLETGPSVAVICFAPKTSPPA